MVLLYMGTFTIFYHQYPPNVSIYTSTMDPMGDERIPYFLRKGHLGTSSLYMWRYHEHMHTHTYANIYINIYMLTCRCKKCCKLWTVGSVFFSPKNDGTNWIMSVTCHHPLSLDLENLGLVVWHFKVLCKYVSGVIADHYDISWLPCYLLASLSKIIPPVVCSWLWITCAPL